MTQKFTQGRGSGRLNSIIDDVSILKSQSGRGTYNHSFGVVRCFLLTDTSATPMTATGVKWDGSAWVQNGLGDAVEVYPNPNFTHSDYQDDLYVFARNFGGRWISIDPASGMSGIRWAFVDGAVETDTTQACFLDTDTTGDAITVTCTICGGSDLSDAIPRLSDGIRIPVVLDGATWRCIWGFQATEDCT